MARLRFTCCLIQRLYCMSQACHYGASQTSNSTLPVSCVVQSLGDADMEVKRLYRSRDVALTADGGKSD